MSIGGGKMSLLFITSVVFADISTDNEVRVSRKVRG